MVVVAILCACGVFLAIAIPASFPLHFERKIAERQIRPRRPPRRPRRLRRLRRQSDYLKLL